MFGPSRKNNFGALILANIAEAAQKTRTEMEGSTLAVFAGITEESAVLGVGETLDDAWTQVCITCDLHDTCLSLV